MTRPAATSSGTVAGGSSRSIGDQHELRREDVARADRELDARDERVQHDERDGERDVEAGRGARNEQQDDAAEQEEPAGHELGDELAAVDTARARLPRVLEEALGGVVAADVVGGCRCHAVIGYVSIDSRWPELALGLSASGHPRA